jgi:hypothetical protein
LGSGERPKAPETETEAGRAGDAMRGAAGIGAGGAAALGFAAAEGQRADSHGKRSDEEKGAGRGGGRWRGLGWEQWKPR